MITLKQVAHVAGVHLATASAVLNGAGGNTRVGKETRHRVTRAAERLGYVRNESARRLRTGKSNAIGFIGGDLRNPFFSELASALEHECHQHKHQLVLSHVSSPTSETFAQTVELLQQQMVSKIIYWDELALRKNPVGAARGQVLPIGFTVHPRHGIWLDLNHAIRLAVACLVEERQKRVCFYVPTCKVESPSVTIRQQLFMDECRRRGLPQPHCASYVGESWNIEAAVLGARKLLKDKTEVESYIGFNDVAAIGILLATADLRVRPKVICFDGTSLTRCWPGWPTTLNLNISQLAQTAVAVLLDGQDSATGHKKHWIRPTIQP